MFSEIDLRALAERSGPERAFLTLYLAGSAGFQELDNRIAKIRKMLEDDLVEREYFEENLKLVEEYLERIGTREEALCVFACWATDYLEAHQIEKPVRNLLWVDSSPYIRPLAELQDEYEKFVVVAGDNKSTRIFLVTSSVADEEARVRGDVKNRVKVGGWSQKRYERRRDKELHNYAREIADTLDGLNQREDFNRILLIGSAETVKEIENELPDHIREKVAHETNVDLRDEDEIWEEAYGLFFEKERSEEENLWEKIKGEYLRGGRAVVGPEDVLKHAVVGRIDQMIVVRDAKLAGVRCRECENVSAGNPEQCPVCSADSLYPEDLVNELVELLARSSATVEFADSIPGLVEVDGVAALLRY